MLAVGVLVVWGLLIDLLCQLARRRQYQGGGFVAFVGLGYFMENG